jgi:hypothetical protein
MPKFLIEVPHDPGAQPCARAMKVLLATGTHWLTNADFGCLDGVHKAWLTIDVESHVEAQMLLPPAFRADATIVRLCKFDDLITKHEGS